MRRAWLRGLTIGAAVALLTAVIGASPADAAPVVGPAHLVGQSVAASSGAAAAVAFDSTNFLMVWTKAPSGGGAADIYGARITPDGTVLDPSGIAIRVAGGLQSQPAVVFDGTNFLVVWKNSAVMGGQIEAARVAPDGSTLDATPLVLGTGETPQVASTGSLSLVVWTPGFQSIAGTRVEPDGDVLDPAPGRTLVPDSGLTLTANSVASNGSDFLLGYVAYLDFPESPSPMVLKVDLSGNPGLSQGVGHRDLRVASNGVDYLAVWSRCVDSNPYGCEFGGDSDVFARKITASDLTLGPIATIATTTPAQTNPSVFFNAGRYLIAYRRQAVQYPDPNQPPQQTGPVDVRATFLDDDGTTVGTSGFIIESDTLGGVVVAGGPGDDFGVLYFEQPDSAPPIYLRTVSPK